MRFAGAVLAFYFGLYTTTAGAKVVGELALENFPLCDFVVLKTEHDFALARFHRGIYMFAEGDTLKGEPVRIGFQTFLLPEGEIEFEVLQTEMRLRAAQRVFALQCKLEADDDPVEMTAAVRP